jgi:t-SNARE complex subunit (syntaxin)
MSEQYIKYFSIGDLDTSKPITEYTTNSISSAEKKTANQIIQKISKQENRKFEERNIIKSDNNAYYFILYNPNIIFISYVDDSYPERLVFQMFEEIKAVEILSMINDSTKELNPNGRQKLKEVIDKYQERDKVDKIGEIQNDVNDVKKEVKKNIDKMVENVEDVEKLEMKANLLKDASQEYNKDAKEIRKITWWKNFKLWIILISIILIIIGVVLFIIFK